MTNPFAGNPNAYSFATQEGFPEGSEPDLDNMIAAQVHVDAISFGPDLDNNTMWILFSTSLNQAQLDGVQAIVSGYVAYLADIAAAAATEQGAEAQATAIPNWASWNMATVDTWHNTNVTTPLTTGRTNMEAIATLNLNSFKATIRALLDILDKMGVEQSKLAEMEVALRNSVFPNLQD